MAELVIVLRQPIGDVEGLEWPTDADGPRESAVVDRPRRVTVKAGNRVLLSSWSRATFIDQNDGRVSYVKILPLKDATELSRAAGSLREMLVSTRHVGAIEAAEKLERWWRDSRNTAHAGAAYFPHADYLEGTVLTAELRRTDTGAWFYELGIVDPELRFGPGLP